MRILAADSGCSILDESFKPTNILVTSCILTEEPYREVLERETKIVDYTPRDPDVVADELRMCLYSSLLERADCVHLDTSLRGIDVIDLNDSYLDSRIMSCEGRVVLKLILDDLRQLAYEVREKTGARTYAIGDGSIPLRLSELCAAIEGFNETRRRCAESGEELLLGLPKYTELEIGKQTVTARSISQPNLEISGKLPPLDVEQTEVLNPSYAGFLAYRIRPMAGG